jgi:hypothetical protein
MVKGGGVIPGGRVAGEGRNVIPEGAPLSHMKLSSRKSRADSSSE